MLPASTSTVDCNVTNRGGRCSLRGCTRKARGGVNGVVHGLLCRMSNKPYVVGESMFLLTNLKMKSCTLCGENTTNIAQFLGHLHDSAELLEFMRSHEGAKNPASQKTRRHATRGGNMFIRSVCTSNRVMTTCKGVTYVYHATQLQTRRNVCEQLTYLLCCARTILARLFCTLLLAAADLSSTKQGNTTITTKTVVSTSAKLEKWTRLVPTARFR